MYKIMSEEILACPFMKALSEMSFEGHLVGLGCEKCNKLLFVQVGEY